MEQMHSGSLYRKQNRGQRRDTRRHTFRKSVSSTSVQFGPVRPRLTLSLSPRCLCRIQGEAPVVCWHYACPLWYTSSFPKIYNDTDIIIAVLIRKRSYTLTECKSRHQNVVKSSSNFGAKVDKNWHRGTPLGTCRTLDCRTFRMNIFLLSVT